MPNKIKETLNKIALTLKKIPLGIITISENIMAWWDRLELPFTKEKKYRKLYYIILLLFLVFLLI